MIKLPIWYNRLRVYLSDHYPNFYNYCDHYKAIIKFIISGVTATSTDLILLYFFHGLLHWDLILATSLAFIISFFVSFSLQKFWTFRNPRFHRILSQLSLYFINALGGLIVNALLMNILVDHLNIWYILAQFIVNIIIAFWNFIVYKHIIFKHQ